MTDEPTGGATVRVSQYQKAVDLRANNNSYQGLQIHALPGLHAYLFERLQQLAPPPADVLDLAAGSGAMTLRLMDGGYRVTATDYVTENFRLHDRVPFFQADLNSDIVEIPQASFDVVMASEIIEHLENPRHFARQCQRLLKPGGLVLLSTPNIDTASSVLLQLRSGHANWFSEFNYRVDGHITPVGRWHLHRSFEEAGFALDWEGSFGDAGDALAGSPRLRLLGALLDRLSALPSAARGAILCCAWRKLELVAPAESSAVQSITA